MSSPVLIQRIIEIFVMLRIDADFISFLEDRIKQYRTFLV